MTTLMRGRLMALPSAEREAVSTRLATPECARTFENRLLQRDEGTRLRDNLLDAEALRMPNPERSGDVIDTLLLAMLFDEDLKDRRGRAISSQTITEANAVLSGVLFP